MELISPIILGFVQGLTEFVPISSTGHLILIREVLGYTSGYDLAFDAVLHLATSLAVIIYFGHDIIRFCKNGSCNFRGENISERPSVLFWAIVAATIPAALIGYLFGEQINSALHNTLTVAVGLAIGAVFMLLAEIAKINEKSLSIKRGFGIGLFQVLAFIPGFSRSGATIGGGMLIGLKREIAVRFAFMISAPILLGIGVNQLLELSNNGGLIAIGTSLIIGSITAFIVGMAAIHFMVKYLRNHNLNIFIFYRMALAIIIILVLVF